MQKSYDGYTTEWGLGWNIEKKCVTSSYSYIILKKHSINWGCLECGHLFSIKINLKEHSVGVHEEIFVWKK